jgi:hypothetical protein
VNSGRKPIPPDLPADTGNTVRLAALPTCMQTNPGLRSPDAFHPLHAGGFPGPDVIPNPGPNPSPDPEPDTPGFPEPDPDPDPLDPLPMPSPVTVQ